MTALAGWRCVSKRMLPPVRTFLFWRSMSSMRPLAREVADQAYRAGARYVSVLYWDQNVKRSRLLHASEESLELTPAWWDRHIAECVEKRSAYIVLWGIPLRIYSTKSMLRAARDRMPLTSALFDAMQSGEVDYTLVPAPSRGAANRLLG